MPGRFVRLLKAARETAEDVESSVYRSLDTVCFEANCVAAATAIAAAARLHLLILDHLQYVWSSKYSLDRHESKTKTLDRTVGTIL